MSEFPWTIFFILLAAGLISTAAVIPYAFTANSKAVEAMKAQENAGREAKKMPSKPVLYLASILQTGVLVALAAFLGLLLGNEVGLGTPVMSAALKGNGVIEVIRTMAPESILLGLAAGILILVLEWAYFLPRIPRSLSGLDNRAPLWQRVLACFYGGIVEELLLRLFLMSGLAWLLGLVWKTPSGLPAAGALWLANLLAALLFGAGHLPTTAQNARLTPIVVARALVLNGSAGMIFGYLYMQYGLEAAMLAHFTADIVIHLIAPGMTRRRLQTLLPEPVEQPA